MESEKEKNQDQHDKKIRAKSLRDTSSQPVPVVWTTELVERFWNLFAKSPLTKLSFSKLVGKDLAMFVSGQVAQHSRILDFGAGNGDLATLLLAAGFKVAVYEPSMLRREAILAGPLAQHPNFLGVFNGSEGAVFDAVLVFEVLEHILPETLDSDMNTLKRFLGPRGKLIGTVPLGEDLESGNCICPKCDAMFHRWQHVRSFNAEALECFLKKYGWRQIQTAITDFYPGLAFASSLDETSEIPPISFSSQSVENNNANAIMAENLALRADLRTIKAQLKSVESIIGFSNVRNHNLLWNNPRLFRYFFRFLGILDAIPGLAGVRKTRSSIQKNGFVTFLKESVLARLHRFLRRMCLFIVFGLDMNGTFDSRIPDKAHFAPLNPISSSACNGKPSVCFVTANMSSGGAERQVATLACELKKRGHEVRVRVMNLDGENGHYLPYLKEHGIDIAVPQVPGISDVKFMRRQGVDISLFKHLPAVLRLDALALAHDLLRRPVDVAHCYLDWCCCYGGFAALLSGTPCVRFSWRNVNPTHFEFFRDWMPILYKFLLSFSHVRLENNTASGAADYIRWLGLPMGTVEVLPNGLSLDLFGQSNEVSSTTLRESLDIASETSLVVSIGRLSAEKRSLDLVDILLALRKDLPKVSLVHMGTGPLKDALQARMKSAGFDGSRCLGEKKAAMVLLGRREDVFEILGASDVFLLTSAFEGMPNVIMEAMCAGIPVVATRVGGVPDLIEDGVHGFLHDVGDIAGMAQSLARLLTDAVLRRRMGDAGRTRILSEFTVEHLADRVTQAYAAQSPTISRD